VDHALVWSTVQTQLPTLLLRPSVEKRGLGRAAKSGLEAALLFLFDGGDEGREAIVKT
jgi:hypothetical protein